MDASCRIRGGDKGGLEANENDPVIESCTPYLSYAFEYDIWLSMHRLISAQFEFFNKKGRYATFDELETEGLIDYQLGMAWRRWIFMQTFPPTENAPARFKIHGACIYRETGIRSFYADETGVLRGGDFQGMPADANSPPLIFENEELIKHAMRALSTAQWRYVGLPNQGNGSYAVDFERLSRAGFIEFELPGGVFGGYQFVMTVNDSDLPWLRFFEIKAIPLNYGKATVRSFYVSNKSLLRGADKNGKFADINDPLVEF